jgi:hypothetical protein
MHIIKLNLDQGSIYVDSAPIEINEKGVLIGPIAKLCSPPINTNQGRTRYRLLKKISVCGQSADCIIEAGDVRAFSIFFLFYLIEFFESSILESKIIRAFEKSSNLKFMSNHPSSAFLDSCKWGATIFSYDAKQGDLSLEIRFARVLDEKNSNP